MKRPTHSVTIREIRRRLGMNVVEFCATYNIDRKQLSQWETGKVEPTYRKSIRRIMAAAKDAYAR